MIGQLYILRCVSSMANHEKSKKHKENLAALKLILQEETGRTRSLSDSDGSCTVDDSTIKCDRLSDNSDTHGDTVDGQGDTGNDRHGDREFSNTTQQLPNYTTSDGLEDSHSVASTDKGAVNDSIVSEDEEDDILLLLAKNKTKQVEKLSSYDYDKFELETSNKQQENITQDERYDSCSRMV